MFMSFSYHNITICRAFSSKYIRIYNLWRHIIKLGYEVWDRRWRSTCGTLLLEGKPE
jgi:hypothetical protein